MKVTLINSNTLKLNNKIYMVMDGGFRIKAAYESGIREVPSVGGILMAEVDWVLIEPNRLRYCGVATNDEAIDNTELLESIELMGQTTPINVRPLDDGNYGYTDGRRRVDVCKTLNKEVLCVLL